MRNPYVVLGVKLGASKEECKKAYHILSRKYHPDANGDREKFEEVIQAWRLIESGKFDCSALIKKQKTLTHVSLFEFKAI